MTKKLINSNTITHFKGDYTDDNKKKAKERRHLTLEKEGDNLSLLKLTKRKRDLNQIRIYPDSVECLNKISYPVFKRKINFSLTDLENNNYQHFHICSLHPNGCVSKELFTKITQRMKEIWEDETTTDKKIISLKASELKPTKETPWWVNYSDKERKNRK